MQDLRPMSRCGGGGEQFRQLGASEDFVDKSDKKAMHPYSRATLSFEFHAKG